MKQKKLNQTYAALLERDKKDSETDRQIRSKLISAGLEEATPKRTFKINTGEVIGVPNVVDLIIKNLAESERIISLEGKSGCGKSSTARMLAEKIGALLFSLGEIFRYLTYCRINHQTESLVNEIDRLEYRLVNGQTALCKKDKNLTKSLKGELSKSEIDEAVADIASQIQVEVIEFVSTEVSGLMKETAKKIVIEGRPLALSFLPSDLKIVLFADTKIRAERRLKQNLG